MRILRPIVFSQALLMVAGKSEIPEGSAVGAQLVGRHPRRSEALFAEQLAHQLDGRRPVSTTLDQDLEDLALVVDGTPQMHALARDPDDHLASRPGESHPQALLEPCVNLSIHTAPDAQPPTNVDERLCHAPELLPLPVGSKSWLSNAVPSVQFHYRTFNPTTNRSAPVLRIGTLVLAVSAAWTAPFTSGRQVLTFHTRA